MAQSDSRASVLQSIDLHIVAMLLFLLPIAFVVAHEHGWLWGLPIVGLVPQPRIGVQVSQDRARNDERWRSYVLANEGLLVGCALLVVFVT